ncbi:MAG: RecQ family ATP-dependent DNA helicase [marine benthic group bacterium]|nr:RecQ family ATP-dependent DNA helicase [Gemmatimonadota bacterium]
MRDQGAAGEVLKSVFGHRDFRPGQAAVVRAILAGRDVLAVRATGFGKSLCFQIPALLLSRPTVVVSPLIALMQDQVEGLRARQVDAAAYSSALARSERAALADRLRNSPPRILYLSPEALATERVRSLAADLHPARVIVDEAHCISDWGHDFRPEYRNILQFLDIAGRPPVAAFTATATPHTRTDIESSLGLRDPARFISSVDRPNLHWSVSRAGSGPDRFEQLVAAVRRALAPAGRSSALVYLLSRAGTVRLAHMLRARGLRSTVYHAGLDGATRKALQVGFTSGRNRVLCATSAFGMGVDHPEIRLVAHLGMPAALEAYVQEAGRAGRDGDPACCLLMPMTGDLRLHRRRIRERFGNSRTSDRSTTDAGPDESPARLAARARFRLEAMQRYAAARGCRRAVIARYFGESRPDCGGCDRCR